MADKDKTTRDEDVEAHKLESKADLKADRAEETDVEGHQLNRADPGRADAGRADAGRADAGRADAGRADAGRADS